MYKYCKNELQETMCKEDFLDNEEFEIMLFEMINSHSIPLLYRSMKKRKYKSYGKEIEKYINDFERCFLKFDNNLLKTEDDFTTGFKLKEMNNKYYFGQMKDGMRHGYGIREVKSDTDKGLLIGKFENNKFKEGLEYNYSEDCYYFGHIVDGKREGRFIVCLPHEREEIDLFSNGRFIKKL